MTNKTQEALRLAEEALVYHTEQTRPIHKTNEALAAIRAALVDTVDTSEECVDKTQECGHEPVAWIHPKDLEVLLKLKENYQSDIICGYQMGKDVADPKDRGVPLYTAPVKHVAVVDEVATRLDGTKIFNAIGNVEVGQKLYAAPVEPVKQEPVALPCCGYYDASAIAWNPFNGFVQCHNCGQIYAAPVDPVKQEPVVKIHKYNEFQTLGSLNLPIGTKLYTAPVRTKDLTVSELDAIIEKHYDDEMDLKAMILDGIAAYKEKNK